MRIGSVILLMTLCAFPAASYAQDDQAPLEVIEVEPENNNAAPIEVTPHEEAFQGPMTAERMVAILSATADSAKTLPGVLLLKVGDIDLQCYFDERHNRMRIVTPIAAIGDVTPQQFTKTMEANFTSALDVRYAVNDGILYAAFIHPLRELTDQQAARALIQTATLRLTFGDQYTSSPLSFGGGGEAL